MITALAFAILAVLVALFAWAAVKAYRALYRPAGDPLEWEEVYHIPEFKPRPFAEVYASQDAECDTQQDLRITDDGQRQARPDG